MPSPAHSPHQDERDRKQATMIGTTARPTETITIRPAYGDDHYALMRLAALDSARPPAEPVLLAEVNGELRAALSTRDASAVADPFFPTQQLLALLRTHAAATAAPVPVAPRVRRRWRVSGFRYA
jgi:hypothetical protein